MKKIISSLLVVMVLFNFILGSGKSYAAVSYNSEKGEAIEEKYDAKKSSNTRKWNCHECN